MDMNTSEKAQLVRTGVLNLRARRIKNFGDIEIPVVSRTIDLTNNELTSFIGFEPHMDVDTLIMDDNPILSFLGFPETHSIRHFSAKGTYLSALPNFRQLAILAIGPSLETIDGKEITAADRAPVTPRNLSDYFTRTSVSGASEGLQKHLSTTLGNMVRKGWINDVFPRKIAVIEEEAQRSENDPVSVRAVRLLTILKCDELAIAKFFFRLLGPTPEKVKVVSRDIEKRLEDQQTLIAFMQDQLEDLKREQQSKIDEMRRRKEKDDAKSVESYDGTPLEKDTEDAYNELVEEVGYTLILNSQKVMAEGEKRGAGNPEGLRETVRKLTGAGPEVGDRELVRLLRQLNDETEAEVEAQE